MEKRITVHNPTAMPIYVGSNMVPPGDTRDFPESMVPPHLRPQDELIEAVQESPDVDLIADLLKLTIKEIIGAFGELSDEDLDHLADLERARDTPRKTLDTAITEEKLKRAAAGNDPEKPQVPDENAPQDSGSDIPQDSGSDTSQEPTQSAPDA